MTITKHIKVFLPGESLWAIIIAEHEDGRVQARIDNHPVCEFAHGYQYGDVVTFERSDDEFHVWTPSPLDRQLPIGPQPA